MAEIAPPFDLTGRVAFVTGAGRGIGRETALTLARAGAAVACVGSRREAVGEAAAAVRSIGRDALDLVADVSDRGQVDAAVEAAVG
ncbi:MAG: SDR family NAD(P)-dependent oxidoreductase, partial [Gemmatimonadaceae bacterium]